MQTETETGWRKQQGRTDSWNVEKNFIKEGILMYDKTVTVFNKYTDKNDAETIAWFQGIPTWRKSAGQ